MGAYHAILGWGCLGLEASPAKLPSLALVLECAVEVEARPPIVINSSFGTTSRHIKRIVQHYRDLTMAAFNAILGWECLVIRGCVATTS